MENPTQPNFATNPITNNIPTPSATDNSQPQNVKKIKRWVIPVILLLIILVLVYLKAKFLLTGKKTDIPTPLNLNETLAQPSPTKPPPDATVKPKPSPTVEPKPTNTSIPPTNTPTPTAIPTPRDTTPPTFVSFPQHNGQTFDFTNMCFPMHVTDNAPGQVLVKYKLDNDTWTDWGTDFEACYNNIPNGTHIFSAQAKDVAGNETTVHTDTLVIQHD